MKQISVLYFSEDKLFEWDYMYDEDDRKTGCNYGEENDNYDGNIKTPKYLCGEKVPRLYAGDKGGNRSNN